jgi:Xaa-Pro dipeptidase
MNTEPGIRQQFGAHRREVQERWERAMQSCGLDAVLVHSGSPLVSFLDDYEYSFRPNPLFLTWLPLVHHPDSALLVRPGQEPLLCFYQPDDYWYQPPSDPESWWADHFEVQVARSADDWKSAFGKMLPPETAAVGDSPTLASNFAPDLINPEALITALHLSRTRKTTYEIECMSAASRLAARAHGAAEAAFLSGSSELEIHHAYLAACDHTDYRLPYNNIVALNEHGSVLHYQGREASAPAESRSFLIDAGCTVNAYCSDITRTYSKESGLFADIVAAMDALQQSLVERVRAGVDFRDLHLETHRGVAGILSDASIISVKGDDAVESGLSSVFYPHGLGHFIGLQTHDVAGLIDNDGAPIPRPEGHPFLRLTRVLETENVLTIEPGLYFIEPLLQAWKRNSDAAMINWEIVESLMAFGGVRIEDNVVVEEEGCRNLTREAFDLA